MRPRLFVVTLLFFFVLAGTLPRRATAGCGTFSVTSVQSMPGMGMSIAIGDFNGDGKGDLAIAQAMGPLSILLGHGDGTFATGVNYGSSSWDVAVADFNGDGKSDIATAADNGIWLYAGNGDGTFTAGVSISTGAHWLTAADFNGDGKMDLAVGPSASAADFNGDGKLDLAAAGGSVRVLLGNGNGTFQPELGPTPSVPANTLSILLGNGDGTFAAPANYTVGTAPQSVAIGDFNADGEKDVVVANFGSTADASPEVSVLIGNGDGTFAAPVNYNIGSGHPAAVAIADFDGDGFSDLAVATASTVGVVRGIGNGTFGPPVSYYTTELHGIAAGDLDGDGRPDIVTSKVHFLHNLCSDAPDLVIRSEHTGRFAPQQIDVHFTVTVSNAGSQPTSGSVQLSVAPNKFALTALRGDGWSCGTSTCSRNDLLAGGASYPPVTVTGTADLHFTFLINTVSVSGGSDANAANNVAADWAAAYPVGDLTIGKTHTGTFVAGQTGATYALTVSNVNYWWASDGIVTVTDTLPEGLTATAMDGAGWTCELGTLTCTRSDALFEEHSYPPITMTVNVASGAPASLTNTATVSGGGDLNPHNNTATDPTSIVPPPPPPVPDLTIAIAGGGFYTGRKSATYTLTVTNAGTVSTSGAVTSVDTLPPGLTATAIGGTGWSCELATLMCTRSDSLAGLASYPPITVTIDVAADCPPSVVNTATVSGGGETNTTNDSASRTTSVIQAADLSVLSTHGSFRQGQIGAAYTLVVHNFGPRPTSGTVTVWDGLPPRLTLTDVSGSGWSCDPAKVQCVRSDALAAGADYPPITLTVNVAENAYPSGTNFAFVTCAVDVASDGVWNGSPDVTAIDGPRRADFDADDRSDILWNDVATGRNALWLMNGASIATPALLPSVADSHWKPAGAGDFDGDHKTDVIWVHDGTGQVVVWLMDGASLRSAVRVTRLDSLAWKVAGVGDINEDGKADVIWRNDSTGEVVAWLMNGGSIGAVQWLHDRWRVTSSDLNWKIEAVGDFFGDGTADILWRNQLTGANRLWLLMHDMYVEDVDSTTVLDLHAHAVGVGDFNHDGFGDVLWWNNVTGEVIIWIMDGWDGMGRPVGTIRDLSWHPEAVGDFDGDGKADIFWRNVTNGDTVVWLMDGATIKQAAHVTTVGDPNWSVVAPR